MKKLLLLLTIIMCVSLVHAEDLTPIYMQGGSFINWINQSTPGNPYAGGATDNYEDIFEFETPSFTGTINFSVHHTPSAGGFTYNGISVMSIQQYNYVSGQYESLYNNAYQLWCLIDGVQVLTSANYVQNGKMRFNVSHSIVNDSTTGINGPFSGTCDGYTFGNLGSSTGQVQYVSFYFNRKVTGICSPLQTGTLNLRDAHTFLPTSISGDELYVFKENTSFYVNTPAYAQVLVVGGGGGGASGGGAGGQVVYNSSVYLTTGLYQITVGSGGGMGTGTSSTGGNGGSSSFAGITALGGGGGGANGVNGGNGNNAGNGGGAGAMPSGTATGGTGTYSGGNALVSQSAGGGAGSSGNGVDGSVTGISGAGGPGTNSSITGTEICYGGGGGGGPYDGFGGQVAGVGGCNTAGSGGILGGSATINTGSGGGGGNAGPGNEKIGGNGASGVVIIRTGTPGLTVSNGIAQNTEFVDEDCDGVDYKGQTCIGLGYISGNLACTESCVYDVSDCRIEGGGGGASYQQSQTETTTVVLNPPPAEEKKTLIDIITDYLNIGKTTTTTTTGGGSPTGNTILNFAREPFSTPEKTRVSVIAIFIGLVGVVYITRGLRKRGRRRR